jgi:Zn finger protein HypA/HybF involved in hydrogenase expression
MAEIKIDSVEIVLKEKYSIICPTCNASFSIAPSIAMEMGYNNGTAFCPKCHSMLWFSVNQDNEMDVKLTNIKVTE